MLIVGPKLLMGAKAVSSPKGFKNGACGGCARVGVDAKSAHRKMSEDDNANNDRTRDVMAMLLEMHCENEFLRTPCARTGGAFVRVADRMPPATGASAAR